MDHGGFFKCVAENYLGRDEASVRIDVFGPPYVRPMEPKSLVAGTDVWIHCPYSGFPISEIKWSKEGESEIAPRARLMGLETRG